MYNSYLIHKIKKLENILNSIDNKLDILVNEHINRETKKENFLKQLDEYNKYIKDHPEELDDDTDDWING
ncbi:MAG TPA: hypothetical protein P5513_07110 [Candidatus Diapherotrites archaeon]|jgi:hypothetical protein|nr:hypothetical protein [Candidatus Diapherotrites archaeon]